MAPLLALPPALLWLALGLVMLAIEALGAEFDGLLAAALACLSLSVATALLPLAAGVQVLAFIALTGLLLLALQHWSQRRRERAIPLAAAAAQATVISGFDGPTPERGRVRWQGQSWAAEALDTPEALGPGEPVLVMGREGNRLQVMALSPGSGPAGEDRSAT
jgi:membrane protein implicated in regulation of membrane protease activity